MNLEESLLGQHLFVQREVYSHHGVHIGDKQLIHYSGNPNDLSGKIEYTNIVDFSEGRNLFVRVYFDRFNLAETVHRARSRLGENQYNLTTNNCEHFASWCITGNRSSAQIDGLFDPLRSLAQAAGRGTVGLAFDFDVRDRYLDLKLEQFKHGYQLLQRFIKFHDY